MSGLFTSLGIATRALDAQRLGMDVAGQNISNVNTPGYARRTLDLASVQAATQHEAGGGVRAIGVRAIRDAFLERRLEQEVPGEFREAALAEILEVVEAALGSSGESIDGALSEFFGAFSRLSDAPMSTVARDDVLAQSSALARQFNEMSVRFVDSRRAADARARDTVIAINELADQIASVNAAFGSAPPGSGGLHLADQQSDLVRRLSELVDIDVLDRPSGGVDITFGNGRALVIGDRSYAIEAQPAPPLGLSQFLTSDGRDATAEITGGRLGGMLAARDTLIPDYQTRLDTLAFEVADQVNTAHAAGYDLQGGTGTDFFTFTTPPVGVAGAAFAITVNPAVAADGSLIAAAGVNLPGDNANARALANLRDARVLNGGTATLVDGWSQMVYRVGRDVRNAQDARDNRHAIVGQVEILRDQVAGVSLDEEAAHLMKFQRAYEATAKYFTVIDDTLATLMSLVR
jgi:flagellar hook-associated protein 1